MNVFTDLLRPMVSRPGDPIRDGVTHKTRAVQRQREGARIHILSDEVDPSKLAALAQREEQKPEEPIAADRPIAAFGYCDGGEFLLTTPEGSMRAQVFLPVMRREPLLIGRKWRVLLDDEAVTDIGNRALLAKLPKSEPAVQPKEEPMSYEPRGKVAKLMEEMRQQPDRIWTSQELAAAMDLHPKAITSYTDAAIRNGALYRKLENGRCQYSLKPFPAAPLADGVNVSAPTWRPPTMTPPRGTSAPIPSLTAAPSPQPHRLDAALAVAAVPPQIATRPPEPAPVVADASILEGASADVDEGEDEAQAVEPDAFVSCRTGEIVIVGIDPDEEGRITLPADLVALIKRQIAWSPAP